MNETNGIVQETVPNVDALLAIPPGTGNATKVASSHGSSNGYTLVTEGVKQLQPTQFSNMKSVANDKSKNLFTMLNSDNDNEDPIERQQDSKETHLSPILLGPHQQPKSVVLHVIRDNIATTLKPKPATQSATQKSSPKKNNPIIPGTYSLADKKF